MLNIVVLMGRLTADPELKHTPNGVPVVSFSVAVDRSFTKGKENVADFIGVVAWRSTAEFIAKYFKKGQMIALRGSLQISKYKDNDGVNRQRVEVLTQQVSFAGDKPNRADTDSEEETEETEPDPYDLDPDELPF